MDGSRLLSVKDVADYLGVPRQTLYAWRHKGEGPRCLKVGRYLRYRRQDLEAWLKQRADQPEPAA